MPKHSITRSLIFICIAICSLNSCKNEISEIRALTDASNIPIQTSYNAEYTFTEKGKLKNKLIAAQIDQYQGEKDYIEANNGFTMIFFDSLQQEEAKLTALHGTYSSTEKKLVAWEKVELYNKDGERLETEELIYKQDSAKIYTDKYVTISLANGSVIHGKGLVSNDSFTKYRIIKPSGELYLDDKKQ